MSQESDGNPIFIFNFWTGLTLFGLTYPQFLFSCRSRFRFRVDFRFRLGFRFRFHFRLSFHFRFRYSFGFRVRPRFRSRFRLGRCLGILQHVAPPTIASNCEIGSMYNGSLTTVLPVLIFKGSVLCMRWQYGWPGQQASWLHMEFLEFHVALQNMSESRRSQL